MADLTTLFAHYLITLRKTSTKDLTTLVAKGLPAIQAEAPTEGDDRNTQYAVALPEILPAALRTHRWAVPFHDGML